WLARAASKSAPNWLKPLTMVSSIVTSQPEARHQEQVLSKNVGKPSVIALGAANAGRLLFDLPQERGRNTSYSCLVRPAQCSWHAVQQNLRKGNTHEHHCQRPGFHGYGWAGEPFAPRHVPAG